MFEQFGGVHADTRTETTDWRDPPLCYRGPVEDRPRARASRDMRARSSADRSRRWPTPRQARRLGARDGHGRGCRLVDEVRLFRSRSGDRAARRVRERVRAAGRRTTAGRGTARTQPS
jgi:hypothetical protein